ncbi:MAG: LamG domain-containing protein [Verrucomicrobia bacterium]|nr:LamG domain-containing protein [Verrucomicrobiota bacterium]
MNAFSATVLLSLAAVCFSGCASPQPSEQILRKHLTLYASFDHGLDADYAAGDKQLYGTAHRAKPQLGKPGLPEGDAIQVAKGEGRFGDALRFTKKSDAIVYFKGAKNFDYQATNWNGSFSFWLKLDPDNDLEPGYCDPVQVAAGNWANGVFFAEFSKDETPRHFRFALRPLLPIWNPNNVGWEKIPAKERPMVQIEKTPFSREVWTHVVFTFNNANTGEKNGIGKLFLNGESVGEFRDWDLSVNWQPENILLNIGVFYVGLFDDFALFNRALTDNEVKMIYRQENGLHGILSR